jgi:hypothetical protein
MTNLSNISAIICSLTIILVTCILVKKDGDMYESFVVQEESGGKCISDADCPFYKANKNYPNERGKCLDGECELPLGLVRTGHTTYSEVDEPICHNCGMVSHTCCKEQTNNKKYASADYAFINDYNDRYKFKTNLSNSNLHPISTPDVVLIVPADVMTDYINILDKKDVSTITDFTGIRRDVTEVILIHQILHSGGFGGHISIRSISVPVNSYAITTYKIIQNEMRNTSSDSIVMTGTCGWRFNFLSDNIYNKLLVTDPMVKLDQFDAGLYMKENRKEFVEPNPNITIGKIKQLRFISTKDWSIDWKVLTDFKPRQLINAGSWNEMVISVDSGETDVLLAPYQSNKDMSITISNDGGRKDATTDKYLNKIKRDIVFKPIHGYKFTFNLDTRNFAISNKKGGATILGYVNRGIRNMRNHVKGDLIEKAYIQSGFMDSRVKHWKVLNDIELSYLSGLTTF